MTEEKHALKGLRVLDFTWVYAGPFAARQLVDLGAEVIKVEPTETGALERHYSLVLERNGVAQSSYAVFLNRGKKSLSINLKTEKGLNIIKELAKKSDILLSNMAPGTMKSLQLGYEDIKKINSRIIYCDISCFGHYGSFANEPGFDIIAQAASGYCGQSDPPDAGTNGHRGFQCGHARHGGYTGGALLSGKNRYRTIYRHLDDRLSLSLSRKQSTGLPLQ